MNECQCILYVYVSIPSPLTLFKWVGVYQVLFEIFFIRLNHSDFHPPTPAFTFRKKTEKTNDDIQVESFSSILFHYEKRFRKKNTCFAGLQVGDTMECALAVWRNKRMNKKKEPKSKKKSRKKEPPILLTEGRNYFYFSENVKKTNRN